MLDTVLSSSRRRLVPIQVLYNGTGSQHLQALALCNIGNQTLSTPEPRRDTFLLMILAVTSIFCLIFLFLNDS